MSSESWMISCARSVSHARMPCSASASFSLHSSVVSDFALTTSSAPCRRTSSQTMPFASCCIPRPVHDAAGSLDRGLELEQVVVEVAKHALLDRPAGLTQLLPVGKLRHGLRSLDANRVRGMAEVVAQLHVAERTARLFRKRRWREESVIAGAVRSLRAGSGHCGRARSLRARFGHCGRAPVIAGRAPVIARDPLCPPGSRRSASSARRRAAGRGRRRCAAGRSRRPRCRPRRRCRGSRGPCRSASRSRCQRS